MVKRPNVAELKKRFESDTAWTHDEWIRRGIQYGELERIRGSSKEVMYLRRPHGDILDGRALTRPLYRYTKKKYIQDSLTCGTYYLNTLYGFVLGTTLNAEQQDLLEGLVSVTGRGLDGSFLTLTYSSIDCWTSCFSETLSRELADKFDADGVFEVISYDFFRELARGMIQDAEIGRLYQVEYATDKALMLDTLGSVDSITNEKYFARRFKLPKFEDQVEWRICFEPRAKMYTKFVSWEQLRAGESDQNIYGNRTHRRDSVITDSIARAKRDGEEGILEPMVVRRPKLGTYIREIDLCSI